MKRQTWFALLSAGLLSVALLAYADEQSPSASTSQSLASPHVMSINPESTGGQVGVPADPNGILYHGGPLLGLDPNFPPTVYYIWYGSWDDSSQAILTDFANSIGGSPYFNINTTYCDASDCTVAGNPVNNAVSFGGSAFDNYSLGSSLTNASIRTVVANAIDRGDLPLDANGVYFVLTSADVSESSGFCSSFCGWHTRTNVSGTDIKYSFVGNPLHCNGTICMRQRIVSPNDNPGADGMVNIVAHELEEMATDPDLNAWFDTRGQENADKCAWTFGTTYFTPNGALANMQLVDSVFGNVRDFLIQRNWVNASGGYCDLSF